jgi:hypothetical protein
MDTGKLIQKQEVPPGVATGTDSERRTEAVKLVEMGLASVETKGSYSGLELGYTPRG